ncbi:Transcriptional regulator, LysR family [Liberibacter crescens BT-1]|uniref:Transcriptional regulator, LysR family n=1 Tax=Liberibacter crescens (strain BT-1) TaxID=1215343 RepID=L0EVG6_LIBCB|nr:LysR family transcriptional regulator [Liberibacter crescens]AGA64952.1 Transcriptional regulator, LysR family [Liberibacter crescens BT-1]AMC12973.1 LysR family transcriptional regulator [Liberibacter crescens]
MFDWDKLRIFHAAAEAGSFTHAAEELYISQSAISRQVSSLEDEVGVKLFHRHARGLILTEQGESLYKTAHDILLKLERVKIKLTEATKKPSGKLRITTTVDLGQSWLVGELQEFLQLYADIQVQLILDNEELDVNMRHADCAIRLRKPQQSDLIQRKLFTIHMNLYASPLYLQRYGKIDSLEDLDNHVIITFGDLIPSYMSDFNWLENAGRPSDDLRIPYLQVNSQLSVMHYCILGVGIALLPNYIVKQEHNLVKLMPDKDMPSFDVYFCYPDALKNSAKLKVFRDFIVLKARDWKF